MTAARAWETLDAKAVPITKDRSTRSDAVAVLAASFLGSPLKQTLLSSAPGQLDVVTCTGGST